MSNNGVSAPVLLTILFIGLRLGDVIDWSWVWILSPLWIGALVALVATLAILAADVITEQRR